MTIVQVCFAPIDAKDNYYTGYYPANFAIVEGDDQISTRDYVYSKDNQIVLAKLNREYLTRLKALQDELAHKYLDAFDATGMEVYTEGAEDYSVEAEELASKEFPGEEADYYD